MQYTYIIVQFRYSKNCEDSHFSEHSPSSQTLRILRTQRRSITKLYYTLHSSTLTKFSYENVGNGIDVQEYRHGRLYNTKKKINFTVIINLKHVSN